MKNGNSICRGLEPGDDRVRERQRGRSVAEGVPAGRRRGAREVQGPQGRQERRLHPDPDQDAERAVRRRDRDAGRQGLHRGRRRLQVLDPVGVEAVHGRAGHDRSRGPKVLDEKVGVEPTGLPFNSRLAIEIYKTKRSVNPLVNAGAIATVSLVKAKSEAERWNLVSQNISDFAGDAAHRAGGRVRVRVHDGLRQPGDRQPALQLRAPLQRSGRSAAGLHAGSAPSASAPRTWP